MIYGYTWIFYDEDEAAIDLQRQKLLDLGADEKGIYIDNEYERKQYRKLLYSVSKGDTIVATDVRRLTRSIKELCELIKIVKNKHLMLIIGRFVMDCRNELDSVTDGILRMMNVFDKLEDEITRRRIMSEIGYKAKSEKLGRPAITRRTLPPSFQKHIYSYELGEITQTDLALLCNVSRQTISKYIKIWKDAEKEVVEHEIMKDMEKAEKKLKIEEERLKKVKYLTNEELFDMAKEEEATVWQEGISVQYTPATYELERRGFKYNDGFYGWDEAKDFNGADLSEFDI